MADIPAPPVFVPLYYGDRLTVVRPAGDVGLVTLWTPLRTARRVLQARRPALLDEHRSRIAVMSNLYGDGMHQMLCNLLYNPQIRYLVAVGEDLGLPTVAEIEALLEKGAVRTTMLGAEVLRVPGTSRTFPVLENFDVDVLRRLHFTYLGRLSEPRAADTLAEYLDALPHHSAPDESERIRVEIPPALPNDYAYRPSDPLSHQVTRARPLDCWEELVTRTVRFGHPVELRSGPRLELLNVRAVVTDPGEDPEAALDAYGFSLQQFHAYQRSMFQTAKPPDIDYSYGNRLGGHFRVDGKPVDAISRACRILTRNPESRNAYIALWDTSVDLADDRSAPCLVTIFFRRSAGRLTLTATYRAHNLLTAWMQNVYGLMAIQRKVCERTGTPPGPLTVISHSLGADPRAPRFELAKRIARDWNRDEDVDRATGRHALRQDPHGYFVVTVDETTEEIVAEHRYEGMLIKQYRGSRAATIEREIIGDMAVSLVSHALWLGRELTTKEQLLRRRLSGRERDRLDGGR